MDRESDWRVAQGALVLGLFGLAGCLTAQTEGEVPTAGKVAPQVQSDSGEPNILAGVARYFPERWGHPQGDYANCHPGLWYLSLGTLGWAGGSLPQASDLVENPWVPFLPREEASEWVLLPSETTPSKDNLQGFHHKEMPYGGVKMVWLESVEEGARVVGALFCGKGRTEGWAERWWVLDTSFARNPAKEKRNMEWWTSGILLWAYDRTGRLPETIEGWSDVIAFTQPTPETAEWTAEARSLFQEALDFARERVGLGPGETAPSPALD